MNFVEISLASHKVKTTFFEEDVLDWKTAFLLNCKRDLEIFQFFKKFGGDLFAEGRALLEVTIPLSLYKYKDIYLILSPLSRALSLSSFYLLT